MKIIAINGSPRGMGGTTGRLLEEVLAGATQAGAEVEIISLSATPIKPCVACDTCHRVGVCPIKDDYEAIKDKLVAADGFIFASPNYIFSISAQLKALFDRLNGLVHLTALEGKYAAVVETSGSGEDEEVLEYMERMVSVLGALSVGGIGSAGAGPRQFPDEDVLFEEARALGHGLCASIREKRAFPSQEPARLAHRQKMQELNEFMGRYWPYEKKYWSQKKNAEKQS
jgi:multimeric flavodoxin WrbA